MDIFILNNLKPDFLSFLHVTIIILIKILDYPCRKCNQLQNDCCHSVECMSKLINSASTSFVLKLAKYKSLNLLSKHCVCLCRIGNDPLLTETHCYQLCSLSIWNYNRNRFNVPFTKMYETLQVGDSSVFCPIWFLFLAYIP